MTVGDKSAVLPRGLLSRPYFHLFAESMLVKQVDSRPLPLTNNSTWLSSTLGEGRMRYAPLMEGALASCVPAGGTSPGGGLDAFACVADGML